MIKTLLSTIPPLALFLLPLPTHASTVTVGVVEGDRQLTFDSSQSITTVDGMTKFHYTVGDNKHSAATPYCYEAKVQLNPQPQSSRRANRVAGVV